MDQQYSVYIRKFKKAIAILVIAVFAFVFIISRIIPQIQKIVEIQGSSKSTASSLADSERKLENLRAQQEKQVTKEEVVLKAFFRPLSASADSETAISEEFGEILQIMRENKVRARSFKYNYDPQDDNFVKNAGAKYHVCQVSADMVATYKEFENFMRDLFKHEHFLEISSIEITPYQKNKRILLINLSIKLYAQKNG